MIKSILIDIDDTLLDFNLCAKWSMLEAAKMINVNLPENAFDYFTKINSSLWKKLEKKEITTDGIYNVRWDMVSKELNIPFDGQIFETYFLDNLSKSTIQVDGALDLLKYLSNKYTLYVASNGPYDQQIQRMKLANMDQYFSGYFVSEKMGHSKPSKEFFEICLLETKVNKDELLMIGDSLSADMLGAKNFGIKTIWFNKNNKETDIEIDYIVNDLNQIKEYL